MSEYKCSCHISGITYDMTTVECKNIYDAFSQFTYYVNSKGGSIEVADGLVMDLIEVD